MKDYLDLDKALIWIGVILAAISFIVSWEFPKLVFIAVFGINMLLNLFVTSELNDRGIDMKPMAFFIASLSTLLVIVALAIDAHMSCMSIPAGITVGYMLAIGQDTYKDPLAWLFCSVAFCMLFYLNTLWYAVI